MTGPQWIALMALLTLYILLLGDWFHRAWVALGLALVLIVSKTITLQMAFHSIDWNTIFLLGGMMIFVAYLGEAGLFHILGQKAKRWSKGNPWRLLWIFYIITAVVSAFLDNVTTILLLSPILIEASEEFGIDPVPLLMVEVMASNLGGMATLIGDPPNILIGTFAHLTFFTFLRLLGPAAVAILVLLAVVLPRLVTIHMKPPPATPRPIIKDIGPTKKLPGLLVIMFVMLLAFVGQHVIHLEVGMIALSGALIATIYTGGLRGRWWRHLDYGTLGFFVGVFVLVGSLETTGFIHYGVNFLTTPVLGELLPIVLFLGTALFSALLDNVPLVAALIPVLASILARHPHYGVQLWVAIALGAAVGGNATVIGASANVVAQGIAIERGYSLSFAQYARLGVKVAAISMLLGVGYLMVRF